jgi:outer membrane protein assembly factor BamB
MRALRMVAIGLVIVFSAAAAMAQTAGQLVLSEPMLERHGLTRAWLAQLPLAGLRSKIVAIVPDDDLLLITSTAGDVVAVDVETGRLVWSARVGDIGQPTLAPGGNGQPAFRKAHWKGPTVKPRPGSPIPSAAGTAPEGPAAAAPTAALASESSSDQASAAPEADATSNLVVAVVNGSSLYLLDRADGRPHQDATTKAAWKVVLRNLPTNGPMVNDKYVYVPTTNGRIETYAIDDVTHAPYFVTIEGQTELPPITIGDRAAMISNRGLINITTPEGISPKYSVDLGGPAAAQLASHTPYLFAADLDGDVFCIREFDWTILWKFPTGSPIRQAPIAIGDSVYATPVDGGLHCISMADGQRAWLNETSRKFLAASPSKVYAVDRWNRMLILDGRSGGTLDTIPLSADIQGQTNRETDRILFASDSGLLQCVREIDMPRLAYYPTPRIAAPPKAVPPATTAHPKAASADDTANPKPAAKPKPAADSDEAPAAKPADAKKAASE